MTPTLNKALLSATATLGIEGELIATLGNSTVFSDSVVGGAVGILIATLVDATLSASGDLRIDGTLPDFRQPANAAPVGDAPRLAIMADRRMSVDASRRMGVGSSARRMG